MKSIINGNVYYKGSFRENLVLVYEKDIEEVIDYESYCRIRAEQRVDETDAKGLYVLPGFIDVHIHGYRGHDTMDADPEGLAAIGSGICENGVTAFLPTTMTMSVDRITDALDTIRQLKEDQTYEGAVVLGAHLEGPFINEEKKGAQPGEFVILPEPALLDNYRDLIELVTIAPEMEGALEMIRDFSGDMNFSLGHTAASFDEALCACNAGAKGITHLFNAMTGLHHREPGVVGAALSQDCYVEAIADEIHINPALFRMLVRAKGHDRILLITDCMRAGGLAEGSYTLGGQSVEVKEGKCTLEDGTIAGSVLKLNEGLRHFAKALEEELASLIPLVTLNQATYLGLDDCMGSLEAGKYANVTLMDKEFNIHTTIVKGKKIYENHL